MKRTTTILSALLTSLLPLEGALAQDRTAPRAPVVVDLAPVGAPERSAGLDPGTLESPGHPWTPGLRPGGITH